jgi:hypothetical protein
VQSPRDFKSPAIPKAIDGVLLITGCRKKQSMHRPGIELGKKENMRRPRIELGSTAWKATMLTITPPTHFHCNCQQQL